MKMLVVNDAGERLGSLSGINFSPRLGGPTLVAIYFPSETQWIMDGREVSPQETLVIQLRAEKYSFTEPTNMYVWCLKVNTQQYSLLLEHPDFIENDKLDFVSDIEEDFDHNLYINDLKYLNQDELEQVALAAIRLSNDKLEKKS